MTASSITTRNPVADSPAAQCHASAHKVEDSPSVMVANSYRETHISQRQQGL